jgi:hypothetical protein
MLPIPFTCAFDGLAKAVMTTSGCNPSKAFSLLSERLDARIMLGGT